MPLLVLHDFDKSGFSILGTLRRDTRRYAFRNRIEVVDLGLRLEDVEDSRRLETEDVVHQVRSRARTCARTAPPQRRSRSCARRRVELNAFATADFVAWIERKLRQHDVDKVVPDSDTLASAYRRMRRQALVQARIDEALAKLDDEGETEPPPIPDTLLDRINERLSDDPALRWDAVLREIAEDDHEEAAP